MVHKLNLGVFQDMPRKKRIEQYQHKGETRVNNPEVGLVDAALEPPEQKKTYAYDPHLDPQLQWAGKAERTSFEVPSVSLHVHERIDRKSTRLNSSHRCISYAV